MGNLLKLKPHNVSNYSIPELQLTVGPGGVVHGLDQCPSGTVPLGGGVATSASDLVTTLDSYPVDGPPEVGWAVDIRNLDPKHSYTDNFVEAICGS